MIQFQCEEANFSAIAFPKPEVAPVIKTILCMAAKVREEAFESKSESLWD